MSSRYITTGAAAGALGVSLSSLHRWAHAGLITPALVTPGGHFKWDLDALRAELPNLAGATVTDAEHPEPQAVVAAVVTSPLGVLIGRRNDGKPPWTFIAGEIEPGESPADAAVREVKEETGLRIRHGRVIGRRIHPKTRRLMIYVAARPAAGTDVFVGDADELAEVRWAGREEAGELMPGMFEPVRTHIARSLARYRREVSA